MEGLVGGAQGDSYAVRGAIAPLRWALCALAVCAVGAAATPAVAGADTFVVNSDAGDRDNEGCQGESEGDCTFLEAVEEAITNVNGETDFIEFEDDVETIQPNEPIAPIDEPVRIGTSAGSCDAGAPQVEIDGTKVSAGGFPVRTGLPFDAGAEGSMVCGIAIFNFDTQIEIRGDDVKVQGSHIGLDAAGVAGGENGGPGVEISGGASGAVVGADLDVLPDPPGAGNVISGNEESGVRIREGATMNTISANLIGTDPTGTLARPNTDHGVFVEGDAGTGNVITGQLDPAGLESVVSGNVTHGVVVDAADTTVTGNIIGLDRNGDDPLGNGGSGVLVKAPNVQVGDDAGGLNDRNVISANGSEPEDAGIVLGAGATAATVENNRIGTDVAGLAALGNSPAGVRARAGAGSTGSPNVIGGLLNAPKTQTNVISGNEAEGVVIEGASTEGNLVRGNHIGTDSPGGAALPNGVNGVVIRDGASENEIGGDPGGGSKANVIAGPDAVVIDDASDNVVSDNRIGISKQVPIETIPGAGPGIALRNGARSNTIGGTSPAGNEIAGRTNPVGIGVMISGEPTDGNTVAANHIGTDSTTSAAFGNEGAGVRIEAGADANLVGGTGSARRNTIVASGAEGLRITGVGTNGNFARGNYFGTANGSSATKQVAGDMQNTTSGVLIDGGASGNEIGGADITSDRNVISGTGQSGGVPAAGVRISGAGTSGNLVRGNAIGSNDAATEELTDSVQVVGVSIEGGASENTIGGIGQTAFNVISGNVDGVRIHGPGTNGNTLVRNVIGGDFNGTGELPNEAVGVHVFDGAAQTRIGGPDSSTDMGTPGSRNLISANGSTSSEHGVLIEGAGPTTLEGNFIGTNFSGTSALANSGSGVRIADAVGADGGHRIGGSGEGEGNVISGNSGDGVVLEPGTGTGTTIEGNVLGPAADGSSALGASVQKRGIVASQSGTRIGGTGPSAGNVIGRNTVEGIEVREDGTEVRNVAILGNSIFDNGTGDFAPGIDLLRFAGGVQNDGPDANDAGDADAGPNGFQNYPVISAAEAGPSGTRVQGNLNSVPNRSFRVELFAGAEGDPSGHGEGEHFLGATTVTTDAGGSASFDEQNLSAGTAGERVTATATRLDAGGAPVETSEFSEDIGIGSDAPETRIDSGPAEGETIRDPVPDPTFAFSSPDPDAAGFQCSVDGDQFAPCTSPEALGTLADGSHTFAVRAVDGVGNVDVSPAARTFSIERPNVSPPELFVQRRKNQRVNRLVIRFHCRQNDCRTRIGGRALIRLKARVPVDRARSGDGRRRARATARPRFRTISRRLELTVKREAVNADRGREIRVRLRFRHNRRAVQKATRFLRFGRRSRAKARGLLAFEARAENRWGKDGARSKIRLLPRGRR